MSKFKDQLTLEQESERLRQQRTSEDKKHRASKFSGSAAGTMNISGTSTGRLVPSKSLTQVRVPHIIPVLIPTEEFLYAINKELDVLEARAGEATQEVQAIAKTHPGPIVMYNKPRGKTAK